MPKIAAVSIDPPPRSGRPLIGFVPFLPSEFLREVAGPEARDAVMADAEFEREVAFRLDTDYPDAGRRRIIDAACARFGIIEEQAFGLFAPFLRRAEDLAQTAGLMGMADR